MSSLIKSVNRELLKQGVYLERTTAMYHIAQPEKRMRSLSHEELQELERKIGFGIQEYSVDGEITLELSNRNIREIKDSMEMCDNILFNLNFASFYVGKGNQFGGFGVDSFQLYPEKEFPHVKKGSICSLLQQEESIVKKSRRFWKK